MCIKKISCKHERNVWKKSLSQHLLYVKLYLFWLYQDLNLRNVLQGRKCIWRGLECILYQYPVFDRTDCKIYSMKTRLAQEYLIPIRFNFWWGRPSALWMFEIGQFNLDCAIKAAKKKTFWNFIPLSYEGEICLIWPHGNG